MPALRLCAVYSTLRARVQVQGLRAPVQVTSGTIFASRKLAIRDYLLAIAIFVNGAKGQARSNSAAI